MSSHTVPPPRRLGAVTGRILGNGHTAATVYDLGARAADALDWVVTYRDGIRSQLDTDGAVLLRGLPVDVGLFHRVVTMLGGEPLEYAERSTPRTAVGGNVYTSTEYPADQTIPMHNESSYADRWPRRLFFFCHTAPAAGGATPVADSRAVLKLIPGEVRDRFAGGVRYTRTYHPDLGVGWREAFQTDDRAVVDRYCREHAIAARWLSAEVLHTESRRPATRRDPVTGAEVWFNQANLFAVAGLDPEVREALEQMFDEDELPRNAYLGDGSAIGEDDLAAITRAYGTASLAIPWRPGDVLAVSNMLVAHGRQPYSGARRILVAMT